MLGWGKGGNGLYGRDGDEIRSKQESNLEALYTKLRNMYLISITNEWFKQGVTHSERHW